MSLNHHLFGKTADHQWKPVRVNASGHVAVVEDVEDEQADYVLAPWIYAASSGGITDTTAVSLVAAAGANKRNHLTSLQAQNVSATPTEIVIISAGSTLWLGRLEASMTAPKAFRFQNALRGGVDAAITVQCATTGTQTYINAQGWSESSVADMLMWGADDLVWGALNTIIWI